jgi:hypothetical protein
VNGLISSVIFAILIAGVAVSAGVYARGTLNHDPSFLLIATQRWLHGATLYRDIMEINPPLIFYLTAPAVLISERFAISSSTAFVIFVSGLAAISLIWCWTLLARMKVLTWKSRLVIIAVTFAALLMTPAYNFGQREHLFIILALPYFLSMGFSPLDLRLSSVEKFTLGLFAAPGLALKPFFLAPALLLTITLSWQQRSLRPFLHPANIAIGIGCLIYGATIVSFTPEYLTTIVPIGTRIYRYIGLGPDIILDRSVLPLLLIVAVATLDETPTPLRHSLALFAAILTGLLLAFAAQLKGWDYHLLPFESAAMILSILAAVLSSHSMRSRPLHFVLFLLFPILIFARAVYYGRYESSYADVFVSKLEAINQNWSGKSILVLTTNVSAAFPLINQLGAKWVGRYPYQWIIAGALTGRNVPQCMKQQNTCADLKSLLDFARRTNVDDFALSSPDVVFIDERPRKTFLPDKDFDYIDFLKADPRFPDIWQHYRKADSALDYDIWIRMDSSDDSKVTSSP